MKTAIKIIYNIFICFVAFLAVLSVYTIIAKSIFKVKTVTVFGFSSAVIVTGSMEDTISVYDIIINQKKQSYEKGDIISYQGNTAMVTHRIIEIKEDGKIITKGDANNSPDTPITEDLIIGKVVLVLPKIGKVLVFLKTPLGYTIILFIFFILLFLPNFIKKRGQGA